jgi:hypothetical protein
MSSSETGINIPDWLKQKATELGQEQQVFVDFGMDLIKQFNQEKLIYVGSTE